jgi:hypothetical protein
MNFTDSSPSAASDGWRMPPVSDVLHSRWIAYPLIFLVAILVAVLQSSSQGCAAPPDAIAAHAAVAE